MLSMDNTILNILTTAKKEGNTLLGYFHIQHPSNRIAQEDNNIFVACISTENDMEGFEFSKFTDLVEILIVTKQNDYSKAIQIIKTVSNEICGLIMKNQDQFPNKPIIRNINPEFNKDYALTRGHIMVQCKTEPVDFNVTEDEYNICELLLKEIEVD